MNRALVAIGLVIERLTKQQWFVFIAATLIALAPAMYLYDQANRTTDEMHRFAEGFSGRIFHAESESATSGVPPSGQLQNSFLRDDDQAMLRPVSRDDAGLQEVVDSWNTLPAEIRQAVVLIVRQSSGRPGFQKD